MPNIKPLTRRTRKFQVVDGEVEPSQSRRVGEDLEETANWLPELLKRLVTLMNLKQNWDGEDGLPVRELCAVEAARVLAVALEYGAPKPHISPTPDGGVAFEFTYGKRELGLDIEDDLSLGVLREYEDGRYDEKPVESDLLQAVAQREIKWLVRGR